MSNSIEIRISAMSLYKILINEYKEPSIFEYIYVSIFSLLISIFLHIALEYIFNMLDYLLNKIIIFIVTIITTFKINDYLEQFFYSFGRNGKFRSIQRKSRNFK